MTKQSHEPQTSLEQISPLVQSLRETFSTGRTRSLEWRTTQLSGLRRFLKEKQQEILEAVSQDLGKPPLEALLSEILSLELDITHAKKHLKSWMKPEKVKTSMLHQPARSFIYKEPLGVVLIIAPWNYPLQLALGPLVGALAAGNTAVVKPSEVTSHTSAFLARFLPLYLDPDGVTVVEGGVAETTELLKQKFDHIFYTGNGTVGRVVMKAAAQHLTPVTLELGGKSPCIVDESADLEVTARRIVWSKFFNCGQTCIAPDYVLVQASIHDALLATLVEKVKEFWGDDPRHNPDYARIVNTHHLQRLLGLLDGGGQAVCGGASDESDRYLAPTILTNVALDSSIMEEEIFGPILPVIAVSNLEEALKIVQSKPKPLALYLFSQVLQTQDHVLQNVSSGGAVINHCMLHYLSTELPFGGVGESGMGSAHGRASFETFTHRKSVLVKPFRFDLPLLYPPYSRHLTKAVEWVLKWWRHWTR